MKKFTIFSLCLILSSTLCFAETLYLKSGQTIQGKIIEKTDEEIKIKARGITLTYFNDEVLKIEGEEEKKQDFIPFPEAPKVKEQPGAEKGKAPSGSSGLIPIKSYTPFREASSSVDKRDLIITLIAASGTRDTMDKKLADMMSQLSAEEAVEVKKLINIDEMVLEFIPIYDKYFTDEELKDLINFYQSHAGRKLRSLTPTIIKESTHASMGYIQRKAEGIRE